MKLNRQEKEIVRKKFCAYGIKVLRGEALNYLNELERQSKREVFFFRTSAERSGDAVLLRRL